MKRLCLLALLALAPAGAFAIPVNYTFELGPVATEPQGGTGSLFWDADTHALSDVTWDFGNGHAGGILDDAPGFWSFPIFGGTFGEFTFEILSGQDVHPVECGVATSCSTNFGSAGLFGYPSSLIQFNLFVGDVHAYFISDAAAGAAFGDMTAATTTTAVSEPAPWALMTVGLILLGVARRSARPDRSRDSHELPLQGARA